MSAAMLCGGARHRQTTVQYCLDKSKHPVQTCIKATQASCRRRTSYTYSIQLTLLSEFAWIDKTPVSCGRHGKNINKIIYCRQQHNQKAGGRPGFPACHNIPTFPQGSFQWLLCLPTFDRTALTTYNG